MNKNTDRLVLKAPRLIDGEADGRFAIIALVVTVIFRLARGAALAGAILCWLPGPSCHPSRLATLAPQGEEISRSIRSLTASTAGALELISR